MKKLIFSLMFMFVGVFAFANTESEKGENFSMVSEEVVEAGICEFEIEDVDGTIYPFYYDNIANVESGACGQLIDQILAAW
jgi:hypothetical protein